MHFVNLFAIFSQFCVLDCDPSSNKEQTVDCMKDHLHKKNKLDSDFSIPISTNYLCSDVLNTVSTTVEMVFNLKIKKRLNSTSTCVSKALKNKGFYDDLILRDLLLHSNEFNEEKRMKKFNDVENKLNKNFENAIKTCDSDPSNAGLFSEILQIKNDSFAVLSENYCTAEYIKEINIIDMTDVDVNPNKINTTSIDCIAIIQRKREENESAIQEIYKTAEFLESTIECVTQKQKEVKMFDVSLALLVNKNAVMPLEKKKQNEEALTTIIQKLTATILSCLNSVF